ncbi:hypothetical protein MRY82_10375 [bacterium]|nr:hypothetical protein [bacterium]
MRCALYSLLLFVGLSFSQSQPQIFDKTDQYSDYYQSNTETFAVLDKDLNAYYPTSVDSTLNTNENVFSITFNVTLENVVAQMCESSSARLSSVNFITCQLNQYNDIVIFERHFYTCYTLEKKTYSELPNGLFLQNAELPLASTTIDYIPGEISEPVAIIRQNSKTRFHYPDNYTSFLWRTSNKHKYGVAFMDALLEYAPQVCPSINRP